MSLARQHRERTLAKQAASVPATPGSGLARFAPARPAPAADRLAAEMRLRLRHDLQRLKQIKATDLKVAAKREMLPAYTAWCDGLLEAGRMTNGNDLTPSAAPEVLPTIMVWAIDTGDYVRALDLAEHVLRFRVPMPDRYKRDPATLVLELVAEAALAAQAAQQPFAIDVLERVGELTSGCDIFDEARAKLCKAIGVELARLADAVDSGAPDFIAAATRALEPLRRAQQLNNRAGTKTQIQRIEKAIKAAQAAATDTGAAG